MNPIDISDDDYDDVIPLSPAYSPVVNDFDRVLGFVEFRDKVVDEYNRRQNFMVPPPMQLLTTGFDRNPEWGTYADWKSSLSSKAENSSIESQCVPVDFNDLFQLLSTADSDNVGKNTRSVFVINNGYRFPDGPEWKKSLEVFTSMFSCLRALAFTTNVFVNAPIGLIRSLRNLPLLNELFCRFYSKVNISLCREFVDLLSGNHTMTSLSIDGLHGDEEIGEMFGKFYASPDCCLRDLTISDINLRQKGITKLALGLRLNTSIVNLDFAVPIWYIFARNGVTVRDSRILEIVGNNSNLVTFKFWPSIPLSGDAKIGMQYASMRDHHVLVGPSPDNEYEDEDDSFRYLGNRITPNIFLQADRCKSADSLKLEERFRRADSVFLYHVDGAAEFSNALDALVNHNCTKLNIVCNPHNHCAENEKKFEDFCKMFGCGGESANNNNTKKKLKET